MTCFGQNIKAIREYWGMSQEAFGQLIAATRGMIMQYETRDSLPKSETVSRLYEVTGLQEQQLFHKVIERADLPARPTEEQISNYKSAFNKGNKTGNTNIIVIESSDLLL